MQQRMGNPAGALRDMGSKTFSASESASTPGFAMWATLAANAYGVHHHRLEVNLAARLEQSAEAGGTY
jgi:hypothetical protein